MRKKDTIIPSRLFLDGGTGKSKIPKRADRKSLKATFFAYL
jgi:hypothetical protein